jgi:dTMP kinase
MSANVKRKSVAGREVPQRTRGKLIVVEGTDGSGKSVQTRIIEERLRKKGHRVQMTDFPQYGNSFFADMIEKYLKGEFGWPQELRDHLRTHPLPTGGQDSPQLTRDCSPKSSHKIKSANEPNIGLTQNRSGSVVPRPDEVNAYLSSLLYAGDRWLLKDQMTKWLDEGVIITSNRYVCSNMAHQGAKIKDSSERNRFFKWIEELEYKVFSIPKPDLVIYLSVPIEISQRLIWERLQSSKEDKTEFDIHEKDLRYLHAVQIIYEGLAEVDNRWFTVKCAENNQILPIDEIAGKVWSVVDRILL